MLIARNNEYLARIPKTLGAAANGLDLLREALSDFKDAYLETSTMHLLTCLKTRFKVNVHVHLTDVHLAPIKRFAFPGKILTSIAL